MERPIIELICLLLDFITRFVLHNARVLGSSRWMNPVSLAERQVEVERFTVSSVLLQCKVINIPLFSTIQIVIRKCTKESLPVLVYYSSSYRCVENELFRPPTWLNEEFCQSSFFSFFPKFIKWLTNLNHSRLVLLRCLYNIYFWKL